MRTITRAIGALLLAVTIIGLVFMAGMRAKSPPVLNTVRRLNRAVFNPRQMTTAGTPGAYASVIRHVGRTSGRSFETPVGAVATDDGFVIALPYGTISDWLKNVLASGTAAIVHEGITSDVDQPQLVPLPDAIEHFPPDERRTLRLFGVEQCLTVRRVEPPETTM